MGDYDSWSDEQLAADVILGIHEGRLDMPQDDWGNWRRSRVPYFDRKEEDRARKCLRDHNCLHPALSSNHVVELSSDGRKAAKFDGGPVGYWEHGEEVERLRVAALRVQASPVKSGFWVWVDRFNKLLPIPTAVVAGLTLYTQVKQCSPPRSQAEGDVPPAIDSSLLLRTQAERQNILVTPGEILCGSIPGIWDTVGGPGDTIAKSRP